MKSRTDKKSIGLWTLLILSAAWALQTTPVSVWLVSQWAQRSGAPHGFSYSSARGNLISGLEFTDIEARGLERLPPEAVLKVQRLTVALWHRWGSKVSFWNGRLWLGPEFEPLVFRGDVLRGSPRIHVFVRSLDLRPLLTVFSRPTPPGLHAAAGPIELELTAAQDHYLLTGRSAVGPLNYRGVKLTDGRVSTEGLAISIAERPRVAGILRVERGVISRGRTVLDLEPSRVIFKGDPEAPEFDVTARSQIGQTSILLKLSGTTDKHDLNLSSSPSWPEERLWLMLATGKEWKSLDRSAKKGRPSLSVGADLADYLFFGGSSGKLEQSLGIKSIDAGFENDTRSVSVTKSLNERLDLVAGVEQSAAQPGLSGRKAGLEYTMTSSGKLSLEGQQARRATTPDKPGSTSDSRVVAKWSQGF